MVCKLSVQSKCLSFIQWFPLQSTKDDKWSAAEINPKPSPIYFLFQWYCPFHQRCPHNKYADNTVIYVVSKEIKEMNTKLSNSLAELSAWLCKTELILNLKKGKNRGFIIWNSAENAEMHRAFMPIARKSLQHTIILTCC